jgi:transcription elongation factor
MAIRKHSTVRITNAIGTNRQYNGHLGIVQEVKTEGRNFVYEIKLNNNRVITVSRKELDEL